MSNFRFVFMIACTIIVWQLPSQAQTSKIGNQEWMAANLDVNHFRNGDQIFEAKTNEEWKNAGEQKKPAWCYYENKKENGTIYGKLYNWYAVNDPRGLAPEGWKIPSIEDWNILTKFAGSTGMVGKKLKSTSLWKSPNAGATNDYNFSFLPGGQRLPLGNFIQFGITGSFWTTTVGGLTNSAYCPSFDNTTSSAVAYDQSMNSGRSIRCIKVK